MLWTDRWSKSTPKKDISFFVRIQPSRSNRIRKFQPHPDRIGFLVMELFDGNISRGNLLKKNRPKARSWKKIITNFIALASLGSTQKRPELQSWCNLKPTILHGELLGRVRQRHNLKLLEMRLYYTPSYQNGEMVPFTLFFIRPCFVWYECHQGFWRSAKIWFTFTLQPMSYSTPR